MSSRYCYMDALHRRWLNIWRKTFDSNYTRMLRAILNKSWRQHSTQQSSSSPATYHTSRKLSQLDEPNMRDTAGEVGTKVTYSGGTLHMDEHRQDDQLEPIYNSSVPKRDVTLRTCRKRYTIVKGGGRGSGISVLMARYDDDDDNFIHNFENYLLL